MDRPGDTNTDIINIVVQREKSEAILTCACALLYFSL